MTQNIIELRDVTKSIHGLDILYNINLEFLWRISDLIRPVWMRQNDLLRLISGFEEPTTGTILIGDKDVDGLPPHLLHVYLFILSFKVMRFFRT